MSWWIPLRGGLDRLWGRAPQPELTAPDPSPVVAAADAWTGVASIQRSLRDPIEPVAAYGAFAGTLATSRNPSFLAPLSHRVDQGAGGLVDGLADLTPGTPKPSAPTGDLTVRPVGSSSTSRPAVQRVWGSFGSAPDVVRMERSNVADADEVRHVAEAGLTGSGTPEAPVSMARPAVQPLVAPDEPDPAPASEALPVLSRAAANDLVLEPAAAPPIGGSPALPVIQRQLSTVPDRPARPVAAPSAPMLELPVLGSSSLPEPVQSFPEPVEGPARIDGPAVTQDLAVPTVARLESRPELTAAASTAPDATSEPRDEGGGPTMDAPLSGFAAAIVALNAPAPSTGNAVDAPAAPASGAPSAATPVQRLIAEWSPAHRGDEPAGHHHDPVGPSASGSLTPDLLAGLPTLPTEHPSTSAPTLSRTVEPAGPRQTASDGSPLVVQRAATQPTVALVGSRPPLVQRQEPNAVVIPPAVQPIRFSRPTYAAGLDPVRLPVSSHSGAAVSGGDVPMRSVTAQRVSAPGPARSAAAVPLPAAGQPTAPVIPPVITAPVGVEAYAPATAEPAPTTTDLAPPTTPAAVDWSSTPSTPTAEDHAAESAYEVVQLEAATEDVDPGSASHLTPLAPPVQRSPAAGPVAAPVSMAPPSRLVQRLPAAAAPAAGPVRPATGRTSGPVSFASMFAGAGDAAEDGFTSVQLVGEEAVPVDVPAPSAPPAASALAAASAPAAAGAAPAPAAPADVDELARRLFEPLSARIRAELRLDRERSGLMTDARP